MLENEKSEELIKKQESNWFFYPIQYRDQNSASQQFQKEKELPILCDDDLNAVLITHKMGKGPRTLILQIEQLLNEAIEKQAPILLSSFLLTNTEIIDILIKAATKMPGKVYVLIGEDQSDFGSFDETGKFICRGLADLACAGALIRKKKGAHLKFIVAGKNAIITTANFTPEGLYRNPEFGLLFRDNNTVNYVLNRIFSLLWQNKSETLLYRTQWLPSANWEVKKLIEKNNSCFAPDLFISSKVAIQELNCSSNVLNGKSLHDILYEELQKAQSSIQISVYSFTLNQDSEIVKILKAKVRQKVSVSILVPEVKTRYHTYMKNMLGDLKKIGVRVRFYRELHGKILIVDGKTAILFTGNFDKFLTSPNNYDIGYITDSLPIVKNYMTIFNHLWGEAASECGAAAPLGLNLNLAVKSPDFLSKNFNLSVQKLKDIINQSTELKLYFSESHSIMEINQMNRFPLILFFDNNTHEFESEIMNISAIWTPISLLNKKNADVFRIDRLNLRLLWEDSKANEL